MSLRGIASFLRGDFAQAVRDLSIAAVAGSQRDRIWLYLARGRHGENGSAELAAGQDLSKPSRWPDPAIEMFLGRRTPAQMQSAAVKAGKRCEGLFFVAQWHLLRGDDGGAIAAYRNVLGACPHGQTEHDYAITELVRLAQ
jgi:lipoprotein NlpI